MGGWTTRSAARFSAIELGEIESVLASPLDPAGSSGQRHGRGGTAELSGYVVVNDGKTAPSAGTPPPSTGKLPRVHGAAGFWRIETMPLLPTGK